MTWHAAQPSGLVWRSFSPNVGFGWLSWSNSYLHNWYVWKVYKLLAKASHNRSVAETKCNERSSRSHSVFRLHLTGRNGLTEETCAGLLIVTKNTISSSNAKIYQHSHLLNLGTVVTRVVNIAILKVLQYYWQYFSWYCLHIEKYCKWYCNT